MFIKEQIILSFVKGMSKTAGVVMVLSLVGGIWYIVKEHSNYDNKEFIVEELSKGDNKKTIKESIMKDDNMSYIDDINEEYRIEDKDRIESSKYKKIFDKIVL